MLEAENRHESLVIFAVKSEYKAEEVNRGVILEKYIPDFPPPNNTFYMCC